MRVYTSLSTGTAKLVHEESRELEDISVLSGGSQCAVGRKEVSVWKETEARGQV